MPWSTTAISTRSPTSRTPIPTCDASPEYATALSTRLRTAVTSRSWLPNRCTPVSPPTSSRTLFAVAAVRARSTASATTASRSTVDRGPSAPATCRRDSSMISCTSDDSRCASDCMRPANRRTASGSSAASCTVSASNDSAPTGVLSSWDTFTTKSRRTASRRRACVRSSARTTRCRSLTCATRTCTSDVPRPTGRSTSSSSSRITPSRRTCATRSRIAGGAMRPLRTNPSAYAGALARTTSSDASSTTAAERSTASVRTSPSSTSGSGCAGAVRCARSLHRNASTEPSPTSTPSSPITSGVSPVPSFTPPP